MDLALDGRTITLAACGLYYALHRATIQQLKAPVSKDAESDNLSRALKTVVLTSNGNRAIRVVLGSVHALGAWKLAAKGERRHSYFLGVVALTLLAVAWCSSGINGQ